jgi:hypothetical protein
MSRRGGDQINEESSRPDELISDENHHHRLLEILHDEEALNEESMVEAEEDKASK